MSFGSGEVEQTYAHLYVRLLQGITPFVRVKTTGHSLPSHLTSLPTAFQWGNLFCLSVQQFTIPCISMERSAQFVSLCSDSCYAQPQFESQSARKPPNEMMPIFSPIYFLQNFFVSFLRSFFTGCWTANYITGRTKRIHNKKVLLRERKRHTARRVAIAIPCYSGGGTGGPSTKNFFPSLNMYQAKSGVKNFSLYWGGGCPSTKIFFPSLNMYQAKSGVKNFSLYWGRGGYLDKKIFPQSEHVSSQIWCQKFFPLLRGGVSLDKNFFSQSEHVSSQIWCQKFFPLLGEGGVPRQKNFPPVWTCIKPNLVSKNFPFTGGDVPRQKIFSPVWTCIKPNLVSKIFPFTGGEVFRQKFFPPVWTCIKPNLVSKIFPFTETGYPPPRPETGVPPPGPETRYPPPPGPGPGTPPRNVNRLKLLPSPILRMAGGNKLFGISITVSIKRKYVLSQNLGVFPSNEWVAQEIWNTETGFLAAKSFEHMQKNHLNHLSEYANMV